MPVLNYLSTEGQQWVDFLQLALHQQQLWGEVHVLGTLLVHRAAAHLPMHCAAAGTSKGGHKARLEPKSRQLQPRRLLRQHKSHNLDSELCL